MFGFLFIVIYHLLLLYIGWNGWIWLKTTWGENNRVKYIYVVTLLLLAYSFFLGRWLDESLILTMITALWLALFFFLILLLPLANLTVLMARFIRISKEKAVKWTGFTTLLVIMSLLGYGVFNAYSPVVRSYEINIPKKVEGKQQLNLIMASDMHFGALSGVSHAKNLVEHINALEPDIVLFPGDIIDDDVHQFLKKDMPHILKQIKAPVYVSLGNHDRLEGNMDLITILQDSGMHVLYDQTLLIDEQFTLIGRKDRRDQPRAELAELMKQVDPSKPVILLDHQPYDLDIAQENGIDLMLSGHTHRGQIAPAHWITQKMYENDWGYLMKEQLHTVVSSGYGFWGTPIRIGSRSEIVQIHVTFDTMKN